MQFDITNSHLISLFEVRGKVTALLSVPDDPLLSPPPPLPPDHQLLDPPGSGGQEQDRQSAGLGEV